MQRGSRNVDRLSRGRKVLPGYPQRAQTTRGGGYSGALRRWSEGRPSGRGGHVSRGDLPTCIVHLKLTRRPWLRALSSDSRASARRRRSSARNSWRAPGRPSRQSPARSWPQRIARPAPRRPGPTGACWRSNASGVRPSDHRHRRLQAIRPAHKHLLRPCSDACLGKRARPRTVRLPRPRTLRRAGRRVRPVHRPQRSSGVLARFLHREAVRLRWALRPPDVRARLAGLRLVSGTVARNRCKREREDCTMPSTARCRFFEKPGLAATTRRAQSFARHESGWASRAAHTQLRPSDFAR